MTIMETPELPNKPNLSEAIHHANQFYQTNPFPGNLPCDIQLP